MAGNGTVGICPTSVYKDSWEDDGSAAAGVPASGTGGGAPMSCDNVADWGEAVDAWLCSEPCTRDSPCLYNLDDDPGERNNVASSHASTVAVMQATLATLRKSFLYPGAPMQGDYCGTARANGQPHMTGSEGWVGPWV